MKRLEQVERARESSIHVSDEIVGVDDEPWAFHDRLRYWRVCEIGDCGIIYREEKPTSMDTKFGDVRVKL